MKAGSCGSERQNSLAGHLQGARKWNKDPETLRALVLQHMWSQWDTAEIFPPTTLPEKSLGTASAPPPKTGVLGRRFYGLDFRQFWFKDLLKKI